MSNLISSPKERLRINEEKNHKVLNWLKRFRYSDIEVLSYLLEISRPATRKHILKMHKKKLLVKDHIPIRGTISIELWGLSEHGLMSIDDDMNPKTQCFKPVTFYSGYEKGSASQNTFDHNMIVQLCAISLRWPDGSYSWISQREMPHQNKSSKHPDKWATYPDGIFYCMQTNDDGTQEERLFAIEVEKNIKSNKSYKAIIAKHLINIERQRYTHVRYYLPNDVYVNNMYERFLQIIKSGSFSMLDPISEEYLNDEEIFERFTFHDYSCISYLPDTH